MDLLVLHRQLLWGFAGLSVLVFFVVMLIPAPYGRHERPGWGPTMAARPAWVLMELPAVLVPLVVWWLSERRFEAVPLVMLLMWQSHYLDRALLYPLKARMTGKRTPLLIVLLAFVSNCAVDWLNAYWVFELAPPWQTSWLWDPRFIAGLALFVSGAWLNRRSDAILAALRKPGETGYKVPVGAAYRWVSCPNYLGEIIEWTGWAVATWSPAGAVFVLWSAANLVPRALTHHRWYRETFADYPKERKALLPFIL